RANASSSAEKLRSISMAALPLRYFHSLTLAPFASLAPRLWLRFRSVLPLAGARSIRFARSASMAALPLRYFRSLALAPFASLAPHVTDPRSGCVGTARRSRGAHVRRRQ